MRKRGYAILLVFIVFSISSFLYLLPKVKKELMKDVQDKNPVTGMLDTAEHFWIYFYKEDCRYCQNIEEDIQQFAKSEEVHYIDVETFEATSYDWEQHGNKYDVNIGEKQKDIIFYNYLTSKDIKEKYNPLEYKIVLVTEDNQYLYLDKEIGKVYAISTHPQLDEHSFLGEQLVLPGVPMLLEVKSRHIKKYYFDDKEIINFLESSTEPLDSYWNIE